MKRRFSGVTVKPSDVVIGIMQSAIIIVLWRIVVAQYVMSTVFCKQLTPTTFCLFSLFRFLCCFLARACLDIFFYFSDSFIFTLVNRALAGSRSDQESYWTDILMVGDLSQLFWSQVAANTFVSLKIVFTTKEGLHYMSSYQRFSCHQCFMTIHPLTTKANN